MRPTARALVAGVALFFSVGLGAAGQAQDRSAASERGKQLPEWMLDYLPKTADERAKAAIFDEHGSSVLQLGTGVSVTSCGGLFMTGEPPSYQEFTSQLVCGYDAVVVGTPTPSAVRINNRGTWLYTEHAVKVRRWMSPPLETSTEIEVLTSGGTLHVDGQTTSVSVGDQLEASTEYLIFLKRVPGTRAFSLARGTLIDTVGWQGRLQMPLLPYELQHGDVPFDRFVDDLAIAAGKCARR